jgi:ribose transport system substrate-binding protein
MNIPGQVAMRAGVEAEAARINQEAARSGKPRVVLEPYVAGDEESGVENQKRQMRQALASGAQLLLVQPTDNAALAQPLREANRAGVPVVAYDQYIRGGKLAAYRTSDNYQAGFLVGERLASFFPPERILRIALVEYPRVSSTVERVNGFLDALDQSKRHYKISKTYQAVEPVAGRKAGEAILRDFPKPGSLDLVFTVNDGGGLAVVEALAQAGRNEILHGAIDGDPASVDNIRAERLTAIDSAQFCGPLGEEAMRTAYKILLGETTPYHVLIPAFPITRETLDRYPGWKGPIPEAFVKPWPSATPKWTGELRVVRP